MNQFATDLKNQQPRILSISSDFGLPGFAGREREQLYNSMKSLLDGVSGLLIIKAAGDEGHSLSEAEAKTDLTNVIRSVLVELASNGYADRILFVGGTAPGHTLYSGSAWITGHTEIAAPGKDVSVLGLARPGTTFSSAIALGSGTSFSAPLVAGVAAQILSMNPFLPASQVKQLLINGAKQPRIDPTTGQAAPDSNAIQIPGSADVVYELDAHGSLSLLSATDDATPICGFPVTTSLVTNPETSEIETVVRIARPSHIESVYQGYVENVTVAQGGRRIGIDNYDESHNINLQTTSWTVGSPMAFRGYRQFLEKDTAFVDYATGPAMVTIRGGGSPGGPYDLCTGVTASLPAFGTSCYLGPIGRSGGYAQVTVERSNYDITGCGPDQAFYGSYLVPIASGGAPEVLREAHYEPCAPETGGWTMPGEDAVAWRADGVVAWVAQSDANYLTVPGVQDPNDPNPPARVTTTTEVHTKFRQVSVVPGLTVLGERTVNNRFSYALGWPSDGSTLISYEYIGLGWSDCQRIVRAGLAPQIELPNSAGPVPWCGNAVMEPLAAPRLMARLANAMGARSATSLRGLALATRTGVGGPRKRIVQPMVFVN